MPPRSHAATSDARTVRVGTAGWSLPKELAAHFPGEGTHLERFGRRLKAVEINSSFYRPHQPATYERWAASVPEDFRFAVKVPREVTHQRRLSDCGEPLERFLGEVALLDGKLGPLLVQLPPSLAFDGAVAEPFLALLRERHTGGVVLEPRHRTWFAPEAEKLLVAHRVARVAADPAVVPAAAEPGGWPGLAYYRWHGSPRIYYSPYPPDAIAGLAGEASARAAAGAEVWCILDNTAAGAATANALELNELLAH